MIAPTNQDNWPEPMLQPDKTKDCLLYSVAYICRCLGYTHTTPEQVRQYREETHRQEASYPEHLGALANHHWHYDNDRAYQRRFWLGADQRDWVRDQMSIWTVALVSVERVAGKGHSVVLLEAHDAGVLLMDPLTGFCTETWDWFLSIGPGNHGCHRIDGWYWR